jgi:hypothetical protein
MQALKHQSKQSPAAVLAILKRLLAVLDHAFGHGLNLHHIQQHPCTQHTNTHASPREPSLSIRFMDTCSGQPRIECLEDMRLLQVSNCCR